MIRALNIRGCLGKFARLFAVFWILNKQNTMEFTNLLHYWRRWALASSLTILENTTTRPNRHPCPSGQKSRPNYNKFLKNFPNPCKRKKQKSNKKQYQSVIWQTANITRGAQSTPSSNWAAPASPTAMHRTIISDP